MRSRPLVAEYEFESCWFTRAENLSGYRWLKKKYSDFLYTVYKNIEKKEPNNTVRRISHSTSITIIKGIEYGSIALNAFFRIIRITLGSTFDFSFSFSMVLFFQLRLNSLIITQSTPLIQVTFRENCPYFYNRRIFYG